MAWASSVILVALLATLTGCEAPQTPPTASPATISAASPPPPQPAPAAVSHLVFQLRCVAAPQRAGGEVGQVTATGAIDSPLIRPWLESLDDVDLPLSRYRSLPEVPKLAGRSFARFEYSVEGHVKAVIVMADRTIDGEPETWAVVAFRACRGSEFDPRDGRTIDDAPWVDASGASTDLVAGQPGPPHCGWTSTAWLRYGGRSYVRDPLGVLAAHSEGPYISHDVMPSEARATGFMSGDRQLFVTDDPRSVWIRTHDEVERWPAVNVACE